MSAHRAVLLLLLPAGLAAWAQGAPPLPPPASPNGGIRGLNVPANPAAGCKLSDMVVSFGCPPTQGIGIVPPAGGTNGGPLPPSGPPKPDIPPAAPAQVVGYCFKGESFPSSAADGGTSAFAAYKDCQPSAEEPVVHLKNNLLLEVSGLNQIVDAAARDGRRWGLFVDGVFMADLPPRPLGNNQVNFFLEHTSFNHSLWSRVLPVPWWETPHRQFTVGIADASIRAEPMQLPLGLYDIRDVVILLTVALGLSGGIIWLAVATPSFRDRDPSGRRDKDSPFSLARLQLAVWVWLIMTSYVALWRSLHSYDVLSRSALLILGISGGTFLGSIAVDVSKREREGRDPARRERGRSLMKSGRSRGLWTDLVGGEGWSLHRLQMVAWTVILMAVFVNTVLVDFQMPDLTELVGLLGISATTYLGLKIPETHDSGSSTGGPSSGGPSSTGGTGTTGTTGNTGTTGSTGTTGTTDQKGSGGIVPPATEPPKPAGPPLVKPKA